ncbi:winged helix-turn-helix transcriptional regulator [Thioclava sp. BHET1]|uniref:Proline dehydrogenase transcriptional activator n=1 Tax=Thioclava dalianensis TaxID=1185766 RepID=A0A074T804_9RHOB|nr:Lrp/AsnC ligand binding domain-containing protein [Thioclava dalianensis]KEP67824.1 proline dehydrogenase transcriptional activator [Thioclava dalianensis]TMV93603.1 winged helix-turn-helix transcriptional regulator [Thioclava sp. BHET1]
MDLDAIDRKIIYELQRNARISITDLARRVGLSKTPVAARIRALEESGLIAGYRAMLSPIKLGLSHITYVEVRLSDTREAALSKFNAAVATVPAIEECYMIAGNFDYLLKVRTRDIAEYRRVMGDQLSSLPFVHSTSSFVAMEAVVESAAVSL